LIASLRGTLSECSIDHVVIDVGGVGFRVFVSASTLRVLPDTGKETTLHVHTHLREDALHLFGFATKAEKESFLLLTGVNGVGPRLAMAILSEFAPDSLSRLILAQDSKSLTRVSGVGKKTAERILLELRDKFKLSMTGPEAESTLSAGLPEQNVMLDAVEGLMTLGYGRAEAEQAVKQVFKSYPDQTQDPSTVLRLALTQLTPAT
jgi:Holliday junction DNA helicase RuvA